jgi:hypothetical protein
MPLSKPLSWGLAVAGAVRDEAVRANGVEAVEAVARFGSAKVAGPTEQISETVSGRLRE